jgi:4-amino-4-deoxy-L-arabinose transferase-like glycosyltransferase
LSLSFTAVLIVLILASAMRWILDHPYAIHWDEALYFNDSLWDIHNLHSGSLHNLGSILLGGDTYRPPAFRLLALPFFALFGFQTALARFVTLGCWLASACFIYLTTRRLASPVAAAVAVLVFCLSPEVISASIFFSTEGPFFLATSATLYFLSVFWDDGLEQQRGWIGLGCAIALGFLSKSSFILIAGPLLVFTFVYGQRKKFSSVTTASFSKAGALAFVVAAPWWIKNIGPAARYTKFAREQHRNSLGAPSLITWAHWSTTVVMALIGPAVSVLIILVLLACVRKILIKRQVVLDGAHRTALLACSCAVLPLVAIQLSGTNHLLRYLCPTVIPLAIAVGVLAEVTGWVRSRAALAISGTLAIVQLVMLVTPVLFPNTQAVDPGYYNGGLPWRIMVRFDQWDWKPLRVLTQDCGLQKPKIAFLGMGRPFNPPQLVYPWMLEGAAPPETVWLWRYEQGPVDWQKVMSLVGDSDVVVTAPGFVGQITDRQDFDNRDNREFAEKMARDPRFQKPVLLKMGRFEPIEVTVFLRARLVCPSTAEGQAKQ